MATESLIIQVNEKGALVVKRNIADIGKAGRGAAGGVNLLKRALGGIGFALLAREAIQLADSYTNIQNRLRLVTSGVEDLNNVQNELLRISQRTRSDLGGNVELFNRITLATKDLGTAQQEVLNFTESLNQAVKISGASATEATAGIIQLSQGLASGALRGDELRSVLEQLPAVADVIAQSLGVTRGQLRSLGQDGKITAEVVLKAFREARGELGERFQKTVGTTSEELIKLKNVVTIAVGTLFQATGAGQGLANVLNQVTNFVEASLPAITSFGRALSGTLDETNHMSSGVQLLASAVIILQSAFVQLVDVLKNTVGAAFKAVGNQLGGIAAAVGAALSGEFRQAGEILAESFNDTTEIVSVSSRDLRDSLISETSDTIEQLVQVWDEGARLTAEAQRVVFENPNAGTGGATPVVVDPAVLAAQEKLRENQQDILDGLKEERAALELAVSANIDYADALQEVQLRQLEAQGGIEGFGEQARANIDAIRELNAEIEKRNLIQEDAKRIIEEIRTPQETFNMQLTRLIELYNAGALSAEQYAAAVLKIQKELVEATEAVDPALENLNVFLKRAKENSQDILAGTLANLFTEGLDDVPKKFADMLKQLAAQYLASEIFRILTDKFGGGQGGGGGGGGGGSGFAGGFLNLLGGFFAGGFANGGSFTVPGTGGVDSQLAMMKVSPRERVTVETPRQQAGGGGGQAPAPQVNVPVQVVNVTDPSEIPAAMQSAAGTEVILNTIRKNPDAIRQLVS